MFPQRQNRDAHVPPPRRSKSSSNRGLENPFVPGRQPKGNDTTTRKKKKRLANVAFCAPSPCSHPVRTGSADKPKAMQAWHESSSLALEPPLQASTNMPELETALPATSTSPSSASQVATPEPGADPITTPTDDMEAALALSCLRLPAPATPAARKLTQLPGATMSWPFAEAKGCFIKNREGKDLPFLERLYLLLSLPSLLLPNPPGRRLGEAIRWKSAATLDALGLPADFAAFEIGDVALLEAAIYPQYASGAPTPPEHTICPAPVTAILAPRLTPGCSPLSPEPSPLQRQVGSIPSRPFLVLQAPSTRPRASGGWSRPRRTRPRSPPNASHATASTCRPPVVMASRPSDPCTPRGPSKKSWRTSRPRSDRWWRDGAQLARPMRRPPHRHPRRARLLHRLHRLRFLWRRRGTWLRRPLCWCPQ